MRLAHFRVLERIGEGGMGVVYRAEDETLRRIVALKILRAGAAGGDIKHRFLREARSAAAVTHANVAVVHQVGEADGQLFIAMELVEGASLRARLVAGRIDPADSRDWALQIAAGLAAAHERGIVHCDLKPENVMVTPSGRVKILDFGLARLGPDRGPTRTPDSLRPPPSAQDGPASRHVLGTAEYMSPEQARGKPLDPRSDVFSFGVVLYEMLTGVRPFAAVSTGEVMLQIVQDAPRPVGEVAPDAEGALAGIALRCLEKDPARRFAHGGELWACLRGPSGRATTVSREYEPRAFWPWRLRRRLAVAALVAVTVAATWGATTAWNARKARTSGARSPGSASATRILDLPPPPTRVPAAASEYAAGMQAMHDDGWSEASAHFGRAIDLDPTMAAAHLRRSMTLVVLGDPLTRREEFEKAVSLRAQLPPRDQELMEALQPYLQARVQDVAEADRRLRLLTERHPTDVELWMWRSAIHYFSPEGLDPAEHAVALDPGDGSAWEFKGDALLVAGKLDEAHAAYERCGAVSINGADCFTWMGRQESLAGMCRDFERDARRAADRNPTYVVEVAWAMASNGASQEALEEITAQWAPTIPATLGPGLQRVAMGAQLAILAGNFAGADALVRREAEMLSADPTLRSIYWLQYQLALQQTDILLETGDAKGARAVAADFVARSDAWQREAFGTCGVDLLPYFLRLAAPPEGDGEAFAARQKAWVEARLAGGGYAGLVWAYGYAAPAFIGAEAARAVQALSTMGPATPTPAVPTAWFGRSGSPEADIGRVYLLVGRVDDALPHLRRAAAQCDVLTSTRDHVLAWLYLGEALEQKGDRAEACDAYARVLDQWGGAKPRSVTAEQARDRAKSLGCAPR